MRALKSLFSTGDPAYAVNREGVIVAWNPAAESTFGYDESEAVGLNCWELMAGQDMFGNQYCCQGCPLREMAFGHKSVKSTEMFFKTAANETKQFGVCTLIVYDGPGNELLVHLCRPAHKATGDCVTTCNSQPPGNTKRGMLTRREKEVLTLLSQGRSTSEVASDLYISTATVRNHTQHILSKLNVHTRVAAIIRGENLGLI